MTLHRKLKRSTDKEYTGYYYTYDGMFPPLVKGKDKKRRQKDMREFLKRETYSEINQLNE
jgi:hypothetical protein